MLRARFNNIVETPRFLCTALVVTALLALPLVAVAKTALIATPLGDIEIELLDADAPTTVANYLKYI
jgi:hypothetical protein